MSHIAHRTSYIAYAQSAHRIYGELINKKNTNLKKSEAITEIFLAKAIQSYASDKTQ